MEDELIINKFDKTVKRKESKKVSNLLWNKSDTFNSAYKILNISTEEDIFEDEDIPEEKLTACLDNDASCVITKVLLAVATVSLIVLALAVCWDCPIERCSHNIAADRRRK